MQITLIRLFVIFAMMLAHSMVRAAPKAELWQRWQKHDPASTQKIDHSPWDRFLKQYVVAPHPSRINRVRYHVMTSEDLESLKGYLQSMQGVAISNFNRAEQKAYWINLYNAFTVDLILSRFPVASIRDINISPGFLARGPWGAKLLTVEGEKLSLDDIEHGIYIWFQEDFGRDAEDLMEHWQAYADAALAEALEKYNGGLAHDYDWRLNGVETKP